MLVKNPVVLGADQGCHFRRWQGARDGLLGQADVGHVLAQPEIVSAFLLDVALEVGRESRRQGIGPHALTTLQCSLHQWNRRPDGAVQGE
jgi:hypothetical protein